MIRINMSVFDDDELITEDNIFINYKYELIYLDDIFKDYGLYYKNLILDKIKDEDV